MDSRRIFKVGSSYLLASITTNIINLFLIPLYTNNLSTSEYGQYNIVIAIQSLLSIFITLGVHSGMSRFLSEYKDKNRTKNIALTFSLIWGVFVVILVYIIAPYLSNLLFGNDVAGVFYVRLIVINSSFICILNIYMSYYSMQYKAIKASIISVGQLALTLLFVVYFVLLKNGDVAEIIKAHFFAYIIMVALVLLFDIRNIKLIYAKKELMEQLSYGLGLVPGQVSSWVLTLIDRYFIKDIVNLSAVGVYSLGYKIGMLIQPVFILPFTKIFTPYKYNVYKHENGKEKILIFFRYYNVIGWLCIFGLSIFAELGVYILSNADYARAIKIVPIIAFSYFLWGLGEFYALGLHIAKKMLTNSKVAIIGGIINIVTNIILIPILDIYGAAISTVLSYVIMNYIYYAEGRKYFDLGINFLTPYKFGIPFLIMYSLYLLVMIKFEIGIGIGFLLNVVLMVIYVIINLKMNFIKKIEFENLVELLFSRLWRRKS